MAALAVSNVSTSRPLKTIGILGGMSWESSIEYYRIINELVQERLGGLHSAKIIMHSYDFAEIEELQARARWDEAARTLSATAKRLEGAGADLILIGANTMHRVADEVQAAVTVPLVHIADATAEDCKAMGLEKLGLLGTRFTMEGDFYRNRLTDNHGLEVVIPEREERQLVHRIIYDELCQGIIHDTSRKAVQKIIQGLVYRGAEGVILGCTELPLLIKESDAGVPLLDTTAIHARAAVEIALVQ